MPPWPTSASPRVIELPPAGTLAGLVKRELKGVEIVTLNTPDDLAAARDLIARHGGARAAGRADPGLAVVIAPAGGTFVTGRRRRGHPGRRRRQLGTSYHDRKTCRSARARRSAGRVAAAARRPGRPRPAARPAGPRPGAGGRMRIAAGAPGARILALGHYQPARVVTNDDLAARMDTNDEWIRDRVGIASRRIAGPDETVADMAVAAGGKALAGQRADRRRHRPGRRRHLLDAAASARTSAPRSPPGSASRRRARTTSTPPAPASPTRWPRPPTRSAPAPPATRSSSAPRSSPT